jgi:hypothetical protein
MTAGCTPSGGCCPWTQVMSWASGQASGGPTFAGTDDESALADLRWHWGVAYEIGIAGTTWTARRRTGTSFVAASSADDLLHLMREDYVQSSATRPAGAEASAAAGECKRFEPGPGERALRRLMDEGII